MNPTILVVDDEKNIRRTFQMVLRSEGFDVTTAESGEDALKEYAKNPTDIVVLDVRLPGIDGIEVLRRIRKLDANQAVIMISGHSTIATAIEATRQGAFDFIEKPLSKERLLLAVRNSLKVRQLGKRVRELSAQASKKRLMIGESQSLKAIREQIGRVAPTTARILITGESGTGKELIARAVHDASERRDKPFVKVNCAAIPEELIESELFGAVKGAYTGATESREGKFMQANGGTLFLDEIGDMSLNAQAKVLRALQEGEIERVGGSETLTVDVRILAATNKDLAVAVKDGLFREDLFFRLNVVPVHAPALRERRQDISLLAEHFLSRYLYENGLPQRSFSAVALQQLETIDWPGNIRELGNAVERLAILSSGDVIGPEELKMCGIGSEMSAQSIQVGCSQPAALDASGCSEEVVPLNPHAVMAQGGLVAARQAFERACISAALTESSGNVSQAARLMGIDRTNLHKKIQSYDLIIDRNSGRNVK